MKKMLVIAVAAGLAAPAMVMADTTLYGKLNAEVVSVKGTFGGTEATRNDVQDNGSRIGIKGSQALDNGLEAVYLLEDTLSLTQGDGGISNGTRQHGVGLKGGFGTVMVGELYGPTKLSSSKVEMFGDQLGDYNNSGALGGETEANVPDAIAYLNKFGPVSVAAAYSQDAANGNPGTSANPSAVDAMVAYDNNGAYVALGHQALDSNGNAAGVADTTRLTGAYSFPAGHQVGVVLQNAKYTANTNTLGNRQEAGTDKSAVLSGGYKVGNGMIKAQFGQRKIDRAGHATDGNKQKLAAIGYDYNLSKSTKVMVEYAESKDGGNLNTADYNTATTATDRPTNAKGFGIGLSTSF